MDIIYNSPLIINEFNNKDLQIIKDLRKFKKELCYRKETMTEKEYNISSEFFLLQLNALIKNDEYFGFVVLQKIKFYNSITDKPVALLIARKSSDKNSYIILLLCRHEKSQKGLGKLLINQLINKAKNNNINKIFLESTKYASKFYDSLGFKNIEKCEITESEEQIECYGYFLSLDQNGGNIKNITVKKIGEYFKLYNNSNENSFLILQKSLHISGRKMLLIKDIKYNNFDELLEMLYYLENICIINNISIIEIEFDKNTELSSFFIQNKFKPLFPDSLIFRKFIKSN
jgi:ribosomal protein S18 acetylase RimI-like enzyme